MSIRSWTLSTIAAGVIGVVGCGGNGGDDGQSGTGTNGTGTNGTGTNGTGTNGTGTNGTGTNGTGTNGTGTNGAGGGSGGTVPPAEAADCGSVKWACWPMPTLGSPDGPRSASDYTDNGDGTVLDNLTGLTWRKALLTGVYSTTESHTGAWDEAIAACQALGAGWRLPTRIELTSIVNYANSPSALDAVFSNEETTLYSYTGSGWWVSLKYSSKPQLTWIFALKNGKYSGFTTNAGGRTGANNVRCVKSPHSGEGPYDVAVAPANHYAVANAVVTDNYTGLHWQQGRSATKLSWAAAKSYCAELVLAGFDDWRLPAVQELSSLVDEAKVSPAIDGAAFPDTPSGNSGTIIDAAMKNVTEEKKDWFWTSQPVRGSTKGEAWGLNFMDGFTAIQDVTTVVSQNGSGVWSIRYNFWTTGWAKCVR